MNAPTRRPLIAGNWKMHGTAGSAAALAGALAARLEAAGDPGFDMLVCPPAPLLAAARTAAGAAPLALGGQDCHPGGKGAHTGDVSAAMLADAGCSHVLVGHSERRAAHGEDDVLVRAKALAAREAGLVPVVCVGETLAQREAGKAAEVVARQLSGSLPPGCGADAVVVAYEPVWAIGTGLAPTEDDISGMHAGIRRILDAGGAGRARILYGGSVNPDNAAAILAAGDVDGVLVGGASLDASGFWAVAEAGAG